jgi:hypothetical protein
VAEEPSEAGFVVGDGLIIKLVSPSSLREQDVNAQVMKPKQFAQLVENIRKRGQVESLPYCHQPGGEGPIEIVSGHHRVRAANAAGIEMIPVLVDTSHMSRSEVVSKQIAHNALTGESDVEILKRMMEEITNPDDLLATGLDAELLPLPDPGSADVLGPPSIVFEWRNVTFTFLPRHLEDLKSVIESIDGRQDLIGVAPLELFDEFARTVMRYSRVKDVRSVGAVIGVLVEMAKRDLAASEEEPDTWVSLESLFERRSVPPDVAETISTALGKLEADGRLDPNEKWRVLAEWAAKAVELADAG